MIRHQREHLFPVTRRKIFTYTLHIHLCATSPPWYLWCNYSSLQYTSTKRNRVFERAHKMVVYRQRIERIIGKLNELQANWSEIIRHWIVLNPTNVRKTTRVNRGTLNHENLSKTLCHDTANEVNVFVTQQYSHSMLTSVHHLWWRNATQGWTKIWPLWLLYLLAAAILICNIEKITRNVSKIHWNKKMSTQNIACNRLRTSVQYFAKLSLCFNNSR